MTFYDIDFNTLYKQHLIACNHYNLPPEKWDKKAVRMAENLVGKASRYNQQLLETMQVQPEESVLDIGCGRVPLPFLWHSKAVRCTPWITVQECWMCWRNISKNCN